MRAGRHDDQRRGNFGFLSLLTQPEVSAGKNAVFVHAADGGVNNYLILAALLASTHRCFGIASYMIDSVAEPPSTIEGFGREYCRLLLDQDIVPDVLIGWSSGGWYAFELACQLEANGFPVPHLFILDTMAAPGIAFDDPFACVIVPDALARERSRQRDWQVFLNFFVWDEDKPSIPNAFWSMSELEKARYLKDNVDDPIFCDPWFVHWSSEPEDIVRLKNVVGTTCLALCDYQPTIVSGRICVVIAEEAHSTRERSDAVVAHVTSLWGPRSTHELSIRRIEGNHGAAVNEPGAFYVASLIMATAMER